MICIQNIRKYGIYFFLILVCIAGGCFENRFFYLSGIVTCAYLVMHIIREHKVIWNWSAYSIFLAGIPLCALFSLATAVDKGMDILGILRILVICTTGFYILQLPGYMRKNLLNYFPVVAGLSLAVSYILCLVPSFRNANFMSGRLAGCFGYANTYALFLLSGSIVLLHQEEGQVRIRLLLGIWLMTGIVLTGSKAVLGLAAAYGMMYVVQAFLKKKGKRITGAWIVFLLFLLGAGLIAFSFGTSTFWGRLLYWIDMFPVIAAHPFGTGYLGFYYMQPAIQTGIYDTSFLHNSILQLASDYGWGAMILFLYLVWKAFGSKKIISLQKDLLVVMMLHFVFDFDLEFLPVWIVFFLCVLPLDEEEMVLLQKKSGPGNGNTYRKPVIVSLCCILCALFLYFDVTEWIYARGNTNLARQFYSWNTEWNLEQMANMESVENAVSLARQITEQNTYAFLAYEAQALAYADDNDWEQAIALQTKAVQYAKYRLEGYETLLSYLQQGALAAVRENEIERAGIYVKKMKGIPQQLKDIEAQTSWLGRNITEQPELELDSEVIQYLNSL